MDKKNPALSVSFLRGSGGLCVKQTDIFLLEDNLAGVNYEKYQPTEQTETAMNKCPTKVIIKVGKTTPVIKQPAEKVASPHFSQHH